MGGERRGEPKKLTGFLDWQRLAEPGEEPDVVLDPLARLAQQIWNFLGGCDWAGFPLACEMHGVDDPFAVALCMTTIRDTFDAANRS